MAKKETKQGNGGDILKSTPMHALSPFEEMERMFGNMFSPTHHRPIWSWPSWAEMGPMIEDNMPRMDIIERDDEVVVRAEMAGVDKKDLEVFVTDHSVTIKGQTKKEHKEEKGDYYRTEISQGAFARTSTLPCEVDGDKARAKFSDGILELTIPKLEASRRHTIKVE